MDLPAYYVDSAVAPIVRHVEEFGSDRITMVPSSSHGRNSFVFSADLSPSSAGAIKVELRFDEAYLACAHLQSDPETSAKSYSNARVEPITAKMAELVKWKEEAVRLLDSAAHESENASRIALRAVIDDVEDYIQEGDFWSLNELLSLVQPEELRKITSVAYLRTSFRVRSKLSSWDSLYDRVHGYLESTGQDASRALRGLNKSKVSIV